MGKTHAKASLWTRDGRCLGRLTRANAQVTGQTYTPLDSAGVADWLLDALRQFAAHPVEAIVPVTHGAALAGIRDGALAFTPPDYEWQCDPALAASYAHQRDPFALTGSPLLPAGLNLGSQLHYLEALTPEVLAGATLLPYAQYWAWWLSGAAVSEVTSLGCHSDLWCPAQADWSPMARRRGWAARFAPLARAGDVIGTLRAELAAATGLSPQVRVLAGLHDSNAALLAARAFPEVGGHEATVLSTGTWFIAMRSAAAPIDPATLPEARDCLVNVDAFGQPVLSARFMGGREVELLGERIDRAGTTGLADALVDTAMVLPSQVPGCGPFPRQIGRWINRPADGDARAAAIALYAALMTDASLDLIGSARCLLVEGRFARSELFTRALASLRPDTAVHTTEDEVDVAFGALRLIWPDLTPPGTLTRVAPLDRDIHAYRDEWYDDMAAFA